MSFCSKCGHELAPDARFCNHCGGAVGGSLEEEKRKTIYEGRIHKCPNCGKEWKGFSAVCVCGYELRDAKAVDSVLSFTERLNDLATEEVDREKAKNDTSIRGIVEKKLASVLGVKRAEGFSAASARKKIEYIKNYPIPNTKEDIYEFMLLASTNMDAIILQSNATSEEEEECEKQITKAWRAKFEQAYQKAKLTLGGSDAFAPIQALYEEKIVAPQRKKKAHGRKTIAILVVLLALVVAATVSIYFAISAIQQAELEKEQAEYERYWEEQNRKVYQWPTAGLSLLIPKPSKSWGEIHLDNEQEFDIDVRRTSIEEFEAYVSACREEGFNVSSDRHSTEFTAYSEDGHKLIIHYSSETAEMGITLYTRILIPVSADDLKGADYRNVIADFESWGFLYVWEEPLNDLITGWITKEGETESISIDGKTNFKSGDVFYPDDTVTVSYHCFKEDN